MNFFGKKKELLQKSEAGAEELPQDQINTVEAFNTAMEGLNKSIEGIDGADGGGDAPAASAPDAPADDGASVPADGGVATPAPGSEAAPAPGTDAPAAPATEPVVKSQVNASLESILSEKDTEAGKSVEVSPFLKSLVTAIDTKIDTAISNLTQKLEVMSKSIGSIAGVQTSLAKAIVAEGKMMKSMMDVSEEDLTQPVAPQAAQTLERFAKSGDGTNLEITMLQAKTHLTKLAKSSFDPMKINIFEKSLNKGIVHPELLVEIQSAMKTVQ